MTRRFQTSKYTVFVKTAVKSVFVVNNEYSRLGWFERVNYSNWFCKMQFTDSYT